MNLLSTFWKIFYDSVYFSKTNLQYFFQIIFRNHLPSGRIIPCGYNSYNNRRICFHMYHKWIFFLSSGRYFMIIFLNIRCFSNYLSKSYCIRKNYSLRIYFLEQSKNTFPDLSQINLLEEILLFWLFFTKRIKIVFKLLLLDHKKISTYFLFYKILPNVFQEILRSSAFQMFGGTYVCLVLNISLFVLAYK